MRRHAGTRLDSLCANSILDDLRIFSPIIESATQVSGAEQVTNVEWIGEGLTKLVQEVYLYFLIFSVFDFKDCMEIGILDFER